MDLADTTPRPPVEADYEPLTDIWQQGWHEAHDGLVPEGLTVLRTRPDFLRRLRTFGDGVRVAGPEGAPLGFVVTEDKMLDQLFVSPQARGTGLARVLLDHGADRIRAAGHPYAELDCVIENHRARAFYRKSGWVERGVETAILKTSEGPFELDCMVFEKRF